MNAGEPVGSVLNRNGGTSNFPAPGNPTGSNTAAATNSSSANFKSFSGKGHSLGGGSSAPSGSQISSMLGRGNASNSRGRSTPETRATGENERPRNLAESKLVKESRSSSATETTIGNSVATQEDDLEGHPIESE